MMQPDLHGSFYMKTMKIKVNLAHLLDGTDQHNVTM